MNPDDFFHVCFALSTVLYKLKFRLNRSNNLSASEV